MELPWVTGVIRAVDGVLGDVEPSDDVLHCRVGAVSCKCCEDWGSGRGYEGLGGSMQAVTKSSGLYSTTLLLVKGAELQSIYSLGCS